MCIPASLMESSEPAGEILQKRDHMSLAMSGSRDYDIIGYHVNWLITCSEKFTAPAYLSPSLLIKGFRTVK